MPSSPLKLEPRPEFIFLGGHPAVDLTNTLVPPPGLGIDFLREWNDVIDWLGKAQLSTSPALHVAASGRAQALKAFKEFRDAWRRELAHIVATGTVGDDFLKILNHHLRGDRYSETLQRKGRAGFHLVRSGSELRGEKLALALVASQVAQFLAEANLAYLRQCANHTSCVLYFYDTTKNHHRQWCSVAVCGNRHKVAEFRKRKALKAAISKPHRS
jgi:predicted RNA-binding Zn ribbon-like protein